MKKYRIVILSALMALVSTKVSAQYDPYFAHYYDMQAVLNPAAAGKQAMLNILGTYSMSMAGFENSPQTFVIAADMPFVAMKQIHGVGMILMNDNIGLFTHQRVEAQYALRKKLGKDSWLSGGIQIGLLNEKWSGSKLEIGDETDPALSKSDIDGNGFDLSAGLYFQHKNWYAGVSGQHLTSPSIELGETNEIDVSPYLMAMGGATFQLRNPQLSVAASALIQSDLAAYRADITGRLFYTFDNKMLYAGLSYSPTNSITVLIGGRFSGVLVGYSYEAYTNGISLKNGSHEIFVGYQMEVDLGKKGKNRHQTTRTL